MDDSGRNGQPVAPGLGGEQPQCVDAQAAIAADESARVKRSRLRELTFVAVALVLVLGLTECLLRVVGFRFVPVPLLTTTTWGPEQLKAMNEDLGGNIFQPDDLLFWSMRPGAKVDMRQVNELGLLNGPVEVPKPKDLYRILCLGDSCTAIGPVAYPMILQKRLSIVRKPDKQFEVINAGVFAYTSFQGFRLFRHRLADVQPDLVTICYGWNDHYLTLGYPDKLLQARETQAPGILRLLRPLRLYQMVRRVVLAAQMQSTGETRIRVAPEDYRENLCGMVDLAKKTGSRAILLTSPSNHSPGRVPEFFVKTQKAESGEALIVRHRNYNEIVRRLAAEKRVEVLDLDAVFNERNKDELFMQDGVHPNRYGRHLIAEALSDRLGEMGVISTGDRERIAEKFLYDSTSPNLLRSRMEILGGPKRVTVGQPLEIAVRATNTGDTVWLARSDPLFGRVRLGTVLCDADGKPISEIEGGLLERDVRPGETVEIRWTLRPFKEPGRYVLSVEGVAEFVSWFGEAGDKRTTASLIVE